MPETGGIAGGVSRLGRDLAKAVMLTPIFVYRWTISPLLGVNCRHLPSCSDYAREAIETNGAWKGGWLALARLCRCHPWGSHGLDPVPDLSHERHPFAPWRYGRWRLNTGDAAAEFSLKAAPQLTSPSYLRWYAGVRGAKDDFPYVS